MECAKKDYPIITKVSSRANAYAANLIMEKGVDCE
jgi:hypothetical protein